MDRRPATAAAKTARALKLPRGVMLREFTTETRLQVAFRDLGVECSELLKPKTHSALKLVKQP